MSHATTPVSARLEAQFRRETKLLVRHARRAREGDPEAVHQARVASRRIREMLAIAEAAADGEARSLSREVKRIGRVLGPIREIDVSRGVWNDEAHAGTWPATVVARLERRAAAERRRFEPAMRTTLDRVAESGVRRRLNDLAELLGDRPRDRQLRQALTRSVRERAQALVRAIEAAGTIYAAEPLHAVRISAKQLRYALELARHLAGVPLSRPLAQIKAQQDLLGRLHDLQVVQDRLQALATEKGASPAALRAFKAAAADLERECRALHARFVTSTVRLLTTVGRVRTTVAMQLVQPSPRRMAAKGVTAAPVLEPQAATGNGDA